MLRSDTVPACLWVVITLIVLAACGPEAAPTASSPPDAPVPGDAHPIPTPTAISTTTAPASTPLPDGWLIQRDAIAQATEHLARPAPEITGVKDPRNPAAWNMTLGDYLKRTGQVSSLAPTAVNWPLQESGSELLTVEFVSDLYIIGLAFSFLDNVLRLTLVIFLAAAFFRLMKGLSSQEER